MKKFFDITIFCLIILAVIIANQSFWGLSFNKEQNEEVKFATELNIVNVLYSKDIAPKISGYGGHIPMAIGLDANGVIKDIKILKNNETQEFLSKALEFGILNNWVNKDLEAVSNLKVDAVTGATMSSEAIIKNMQAIIDTQLNNKNVEKTTVNKLDLFKGLMVLFIGLLGGFSFFVPKRANKIRNVIAFLSIVILGFWQGAMLSIAKISAWLLNGIPNIYQMPLFLIFLASILIPMITGRNFYCYHVCPFGLSQDLVAKSIKLNIKIKVFKWMEYIRVVMLLSCFILLLFGVGFYIGNIEPFSAFKIEFAPISAIIIFIVSLVMATINPRFWCKFFCPCGAFLDLFKKR